MADDFAGLGECPCCGEVTRARRSKTGGISESCSACGWQGFAKSPRAVAGRSAKLRADGGPAKGPAKSDATEEPAWFKALK